MNSYVIGGFCEHFRQHTVGKFANLSLAEGGTFTSHRTITALLLSDVRLPLNLTHNHN